MTMSAPKDMQTLPQSAGSTDTSSISNPDSPDAVLSIHSGFGQTIREDPGMRRNANWWVAHLVCLDVKLHSDAAAVGPRPSVHSSSHDSDVQLFLPLLTAPSLVFHSADILYHSVTGMVGAGVSCCWGQGLRGRPPSSADSARAPCLSLFCC